MVLLWPEVGSFISGLAVQCADLKTSTGTTTSARTILLLRIVLVLDILNGF